MCSFLVFSSFLLSVPHFLVSSFLAVLLPFRSSPFPCFFFSWRQMGHTPNTAGTFRKKFRKNSRKTPETLSERFLEFPSRVRLGCPKPYNSRHLRLPERFQNSLPPSTGTGWERLFFQKWFRRGPLRAGHGIPSSTGGISEQSWRVAGRESGSPELLGSPPTSPEVPRTSPEVFRRLPWKFSRYGTKQQSRGSPEVSLTYPDVPQTSPEVPGLPRGGQPLSLGSLTPSPDSQELSLIYKSLLSLFSPCLFSFPLLLFLSLLLSVHVFLLLLLAWLLSVLLSMQRFLELSCILGTYTGVLQDGAPEGREKLERNYSSHVLGLYLPLKISNYL